MPFPMHAISRMARFFHRADAQLMYPNPDKWDVLLDHFHEYVIDSVDGNMGWSEDVVEAGAGSNAETLDDATRGSVLKIVTAAGANDGWQIQWNSEFVQLSDDKNVEFGVRFQTADATQSRIQMGVAITDTSIIAACTDVVGFKKDDGDANIDAWTKKDTTNADSTDTTVDLEDDTWVTLSFKWNGRGGTINYYVNGAQKAQHSTAANIPQNEVLAPFFAFLNGSAAARTILLDYIYVIQEL